jgi:putative DNA methylase
MEPGDRRGGLVGGMKRKLIEVTLPLEAINRACKKEKDRKVGKPQQIHHWWARRPIVAARAVLFAQLVDDPSAHPDRFPTLEDQAVERRRLFDLIEKLIEWDSLNDEALLRGAYDEIAKCFDGNPPAVLDPFAGGGSIPLEAQRLGLEAHATDLNPVAVLINKALIEIPPKFAGRAPVFPNVAESRLGDWPRATGLAQDVRRYGKWMRGEAERRIGHLYPKAKLPDGREANVIAWVWARTVTCPNPACGIQMPLVRSWWLGKKKGKEAYVVPLVGNGRVEFSIGHDPGQAPAKGTDGTVTRNGAVCLACGSAVPLAYLRAEGKARRLGAQLMTVVAEGNRRREYLPPTAEHEQAAEVPLPDGAPDTEIPHNPRALTTPNYGMNRHYDLFTPRQLTALITFSDLVKEARDKVLADAAESFASGYSDVDSAAAYADSIATYIGLAVSRLSDWSNSLCRWECVGQVSQQLFNRHAIAMVWDYSEAFVLGRSSGSFEACLESVARSIDRLNGRQVAYVRQADARVVGFPPQAVVATDPPYYDNVGYADLADFFYIWLRRSLDTYYPSILGTMLGPKADELVADPFRRGGRDEAKEYFENGFVSVFDHIRRSARPDVPITIFYAHKQAETDTDGTASTGWVVLLEGLVRSGWEIVATWPLWTEMSSRMRSLDSNALASSVVLACRPRPDDAAAATRRAFLGALTEELPSALRELQQGAIAPLDLEQAAIGPGMAIFSRYSKVVEPDGSDMTVRRALTLINEALDQVLSEQEGDFDPDTRFCVKWFAQFGWDAGGFGFADQVARTTTTSVDGIVDGGIFWAKAGKAGLLRPDELSDRWSPATDERLSVWEVVVRLAQELQTGGIEAAARLMAQAGQRVDLDTAKELAYLLFSICEKRHDTKSALLFNSLGTSWSDLSAAARTGGTLTPPPAPDQLDFDSL